ncbi:MAG TPA: serine hydrolase domain-containing protein [Gemmatimonadales bacterium]|nr:serine hydrolase domain-containing protein [Gemmatimonadales bacterium]
MRDLFQPFDGPTVPGASVIVIRDGRVVYQKAFGMADLEAHVAATPATDYRLASLTKEFTATATMLLVREGKLRYDEPVRQILPELPASAARVTIRHLLNHTSGLPDYEDLIPDTQTVQVSDQDVLARLSRKDSLYFPPGSAYRYSNSGYVLLGLIVARVSRQPFPQFLHDRIFGPLGMDGTLAYVRGGPNVPGRAYGYTVDSVGIRRTDQSVTSATLGDGGVYSSVEDLRRWDEALATGRLLDSAELALATTPPVLADGSTSPYGFGWFVDTYRGERRWRHHGETMGFTNAIQRFPDRRFTVIILTNRLAGTPWTTAERVADRLLFGNSP